MRLAFADTRALLGDPTHTKVIINYIIIKI